MPPGRTWLIPVRFDAGDIPEWDLGAGRGLDDLNYADLFGPSHTANAASLVTTIHRVMGDKRLSPATALAAVEQATSADRADLLRRLTKEMLLDPSRRIELDDLVSQEVQRVNAVLKDADQVAGPLDGTNEEQLVTIASRVDDLWELSKPFCASLQVAARWGSSGALEPWANGIRSFVAAASRMESGIQAFLELRYMPSTVCVMTAGVACVSSGNWSNLKTLVLDQTVRDRYERTPLSIIEVVDQLKPFKGTTELVPSAIARAAIQNRDVADAAKDFTERRHGHYYTPAAEWLHHILRPIFVDQLPDDDEYSSQFERAEVMFGVLAQDAVNVRALASENGRAYGATHWFGRSVWRAAHGQGNPVMDFTNEFERQGTSWGPVRERLFGGDEDRAGRALKEYGAEFTEYSRRRM